MPWPRSRGHHRVLQPRMHLAIPQRVDLSIRKCAAPLEDRRHIATLTTAASPDSIGVGFVIVSATSATPMRHLLQPASEGDRLLGDQRLAHLELDLGVPIERDVARVALVQLAVVDGNDMALSGPEDRRPERLAPFIEEVAER